MHPLQFSATVVSGSGRGRTLGVPTINLSLSDVPTDLTHGIYACFVACGDQWVPAALHYGPRPVFRDTPSCEVHLLDGAIDPAPERLTIAVIEYVRTIEDFPSVAALQEQMARDCAEIRAILASHDPRATQTPPS